MSDTIVSFAAVLGVVLRAIERDGDFYVAGKTDIAPPNLSVEGVGLISLPFQHGQLEQLRACATLAPFGRGEQTLVDATVRNTWQIDADRLSFGGRNWQRSLDAIVASAAEGLGVNGRVDAQLYKLLIYDAGSFFVEHRDTEKAPGMFATLVLVLPSIYRGGELLIRHGGREVCLDLVCADPSDAAYAAFYADCVHEVRPVSTGTRLALVYNLLRKGKAVALPPARHAEQQARVAHLLEQWMAHSGKHAKVWPDKLVYPLEHAYSAAELGIDALKGTDAAVAQVLATAAAQAGCEVHLAQLTIDESGSAEYDGEWPRRHRSGTWRDGGRDEEQGDDEYDDHGDAGDAAGDDYAIGEIVERHASLAGWRAVDGAILPLGALPLRDGELCPPDAFDGAQPDRQHFHEATGNEGASFDRTYRRAALVLWPRARRLDVISRAAHATTLPYLEQLLCDGDAGARMQAETLARLLVRSWPGDDAMHVGGEAARMLASLMQLDHPRLIGAFLATVPARGHYDGDENDALARAALLLPPRRAAVLIEKIIVANAPCTLSACADLLARACRGRDDAPALLAPAAAILVGALLGRHASVSRCAGWRAQAAVDAALVLNLLTALHRVAAPGLAGQALEHMLAAFPADEVLVPAALRVADDAGLAQSAAAARLRAWALAHLRRRMALPLAAPADWRRPDALTCQCQYCAQLAAFLANPRESRWVYSAAEAQRCHVEHTIRASACDVDRVTVRKGRPYSLVCTKNEASYQRRLKQRASDQELAQRLELAVPPTA